LTVVQPIPSIRGRLANALLTWSVLWSLGVALAVGIAAQHEVNELLDESLQSTARVLAAALRQSANGSLDEAMPASDDGEFAWQLVAADARVLRRSANAPASALRATATAGFSDTPEWRIFGNALGAEGRMVYVAHTQRERVEARGEVLLSAVLGALSIGLLGHLWLRFRVRRELSSLERLSDRLAGHDPLDAAHTLGAPERAELAPMHRAIDDLGTRLARRIALERAFSSHAAHALRTPLAGMDAQLAVALRECPPEVQPRLARVREASGRLQRVVRSLLDLFRAGNEPQRQRVEVRALLAHLPVEGLALAVDAGAPLHADPDLLAAALSNLLDNAQRHGARGVQVSQPAAQTLRLHDDGPGVPHDKLASLRAGLAAQDYESRTGLGLMLADLVARAHGGALVLPDVASGFAVELHLGPAR
jgi:signal transduction histidine kinase